MMHLRSIRRAKTGLVQCRWFTSEYCKYSTLAAVFSRYGPPGDVISVKQTELPPISQTGVRLKFLAAPINPADINQIQGTYPVKARFLDELGGDAVGGNEGVAEVIEVGSSVKTLRIGDWVIPKHSGFGTWREFATTSEEELFRVDSEGLSPDLVGSLAVNPCTAYRILKDFASLQPGDVIVQNGANSAVGQAVIQLAHEWGIKTVNSIRDRADFSEVKRNLMDLGADAVVTEESLRKSDSIVASLGEPPKLGLNCIGGMSATNVARLLRPGGKLVTYGGMSREPVTVPTSLLIFKDVQFIGFWMTRWYTNCTDQDRRGMMDDLIRLARNGKFKEAPHDRLVWTRDAHQMSATLQNLLGDALGGKGRKTYFVSS